MSNTHDIAVIGSGPGGYVAAIRAAQLGAKVVCIDKGPLGGTCLNRGCIPTKALLEASHLAASAARAKQFGVEFGEPVVDFRKIIERKDAVVARLRRGVESLFEANGVEHLKGIAKLAGPDEIEVASAAGGKTTVQAKRIIIATGSEPVDVPAFAFDWDLVLSSAGALRLKALPKSLLIIGGGYIGCEFACFFAELGAAVTVVEMLDRLLPLGDPDVSSEITRALKRLKVKVHAGTRVDKLEKESGRVVGALSDGSVVEAEKALVAVGRKLNSDDIGLDAAGVRLGEKGEILVNEHCQTNVPNIYAIGDVTGKMLLAHLASKMGIVAAEHAMGEDAEIDYTAVPACVFTHPEAASVGLTEAEAAEQGIEARSFKFPIQVLGKAQAVGETGGFVKLVGDAETGQLLGAQIVCSRAGDLIGEVTLGLRMEMTVEELAHTIHTHPTLAEGLMEAADGWLGRGIHYSG